jgi:hypothetical protein
MSTASALSAAREEGSDAPNQGVQTGTEPPSIK